MQRRNRAGVSPAPQIVDQRLLRENRGVIMSAHSRKFNVSVLACVFVMFIAFGFLSLPSCGPGAGTALADPGTGWEDQSANYFDINRTSVAAAGADTAWVGGWYGSMIATTTGGSTWESQYTGTANPIYGISPVDANTAWAVSTSYGSSAFIRTADGGATWVVLKTGNEAGVPEAVSAVDSSTAWIAGSEYGTLMNRMVWKTTDGGSTWVRKDTPSGMGLTGISAVDANTAWAVGPSSGLGGENGVLFKTTDGGDSWVAQGTDVPPLKSVCAVDAYNAWAAGSDGTVLKTTDGGANWVKVRTGTESIASFSAVDASVAYMVGQGGLILRTGDGGATWVPQGSVTADLAAVYAVDHSVAWAAGAGGIVLRTTNAGAAWQEMIDTTQGFRNDLNCVDAVDADTAWAGGDGVLVKTTDGGANWDVVYTSGSTRIFDICALDENDLWVVGIDGNNGFIYKTADGGANWSLQYYLEGTAFTAVSAVDADTAWVSGWNGVILKTTDGGGSWTPQSCGTTYEVSSVCAVDANTAWATAWSATWPYDPSAAKPYPPYDGAPYLPVLLKTIDGGGNWTACQSMTYNEGFREISAVDAGNAIAVGIDVAYYPGPYWYWSLAYGGVYALLPVGHYATTASHDGGVTWYPEAANIPVSLTGVVMTGPQTAWCVGSAGTIAKTLDGGYTWNAQVSGTSYNLNGIDAVDDANAWAVGYAGTILHYSVDSSDLPTVTSVTPDTATQVTWSLDLQVAGTGFQPGAAVRLEKGAVVLNSSFVNVVSSNQITCSVGFFGVEPGVYDVVVANPDGGEARLPAGFTVTSACGAGSGAALLVLGLTLGLLSLAGTAGARKRKRAKPDR